MAGQKAPVPCPKCGGEMFWQKVDRSDVNGCWLWTGGTNGRYGVLQRGGGNRATTRRFSAHRYSYESAVGPIASGLVVRHKCDTPLCVRPDHLELGTQRENIRDAIEKGRFIRQMRHTHCKRGHAFTLENAARGKGDTQRCRECANAARRKVGGRGAYKRGLINAR